MAKNPFEETAWERALRLISNDPVERMKATVGVKLFEEIRPFTLPPNALLEMPTFQLPSETLAQWSRIADENKKALGPVAKALEALAADMQAVTAQAELFQREVARTLGSQLAAYERQMKQVAGPLFSAAAELEKQQSALAAAVLGQRRWSEFSVSAEILGNHYRMIAESGLFVLEAGPAIMAVAQALETVQPDAAPDSSVIDMLLGMLVSLLMRLAQNTKKRAAGMDIIEIMLILVALKGLWPDYTPTDRQRDNETHDIVERIESQVKRVAAVRNAEAAYVNSLPKAVVVGTGRVRKAPTRDAAVSNKLPRDTVVAIVEKRGRWRRVIFHDQLADQLAQGWVWGGSLEPLG